MATYHLILVGPQGVQWTKTCTDNDREVLDAWGILPDPSKNPKKAGRPKVSFLVKFPAPAGTPADEVRSETFSGIRELAMALGVCYTTMATLIGKLPERAPGAAPPTITRHGYTISREADEIAYLAEHGRDS